MTIAKVITYAERAYERWVLEAVAMVRKTYIIPYCNKHKVRFICGNGEWYILNADGSEHASWGLDDGPLPKRMYAGLSQGIYYGRQSLGSYCTDYTPPALRKTSL